MSQTPVIADAGDAAVVAAFDERVDPAVNDVVIALAARVHGARIAGILDVVPAFHSVTVHFDPLTIDRQALRAQLSALAADGAETAIAGAHHEVPVRYEGEDLQEVASKAGLTEQDVVSIHSATVYRVFMLGFLPGFAYMGPLDPRITIPRRATPRVRVPAGSVAIAGEQTGIYPMESPGGWHLIGRTSVVPFDSNRAQPFLFSAGDTVRFVPS